jgi:hypothetical protein
VRAATKCFVIFRKKIYYCESATFTKGSKLSKKNKPMYYSRLFVAKQTAVSLCALIGLIICCAPAAPGQDKGLQFMPAPPPLKSVTRDERSQLASARDPKTRMRATIELADARLSRAEQLAGGQQYSAACDELGSYQGLIENFMSFLDESEKKGKLRDVYKRLEITLRAQGARIEAIRRVTPSEHAVNIKTILEFASHARTVALNSFFGDALASDVAPSKEQTANEEPATEASVSPPGNQQ